MTSMSGLISDGAELIMPAYALSMAAQAAFSRAGVAWMSASGFSSFLRRAVWALAEAQKSEPVAVCVPVSWVLELVVGVAAVELTPVAVVVPELDEPPHDAAPSASSSAQHRHGSPCRPHARELSRSQAGESL